MSLTEYLKEEHNITRYMTARVFIMGMFCGACLGVLFVWLAVV